MDKRLSKKMTNHYIDDLPVGEKFQPRHIVSYIENMTFGKNRPHDGTITRYIRERREQKMDIELVEHNKSIYRKIEKKNL
jgi:hypothetical protein